MIFRDKIFAQLTAKQAGFRNYNDAARNEAQVYAEALAKLAGLSSAEVQRAVAHLPTPGALPTAEFDAARRLQMRFPHEFHNHEHARQWAAETLLHHTTVAADGSQILPVKEFSIPVAAVQVAWFINAHTRTGWHIKDADFQVLAPDELMIELNGERIVSESQVNLKRFELEINTLCRLLQEVAANPNLMEKRPLVLFDSSLVISFVDRLQEDQRREYTDLVLKLLRCSEELRVPLIGYVDTSYASDLTHLLSNCFGLRESDKIHDAQLVNDLLHWGDRTPLFVCARGSADKKQQGILESFAEYRRGIGFVYLKTHSSLPPARLEIPLWIHEAGWLDEVMDLIRAEVIVGNGYPYVLETADAAAVITARDREAFYAIFQKFAADQDIDLRISQKAVSKFRRR
ncbi:MAG TPA: DNA double-strand break repair nuclease NurA [Blastocatellia bacterium]|nr:DNA double-strand break repair nuclease NurA [Blastocatellia bacterium]